MAFTNTDQQTELHNCNFVKSIWRLLLYSTTASALISALLLKFRATSFLLGESRKS